MNSVYICTKHLIVKIRTDKLKLKNHYAIMSLSMVLVIYMYIFFLKKMAIALEGRSKCHILILHKQEPIAPHLGEEQ